jgi:Cu(I)/Ag(I) efflux system membrane protein CusA/SilA
LGEEFMPPFDEGQFLYMPTVMPHASLGQALEQLKLLDAAIMQIPEVEVAVGKLGRADSALDPAPVSMFETIVTYKPEWRTEPDGTRVRQWRDHIASTEDIWQEVLAAAKQPGVTSAPKLMPIQTRIVMLQSGMRAPMGVKLQGPDLESLEAAGKALEEVLRQAPMVRPQTVFAERVVGKPYLEIKMLRDELALHGLTIDDVQRTLQIALSGQALTSVIQGRERFDVRVRYERGARQDPEALSRLLVPTSSGRSIPLGQLTELVYVKGPQAIKSEDTFLTSYVIFDRVEGAAELEVIEQVRELIESRREDGSLTLPAGVSYDFAGSYENQVRSAERLAILVPLALLLIFLVLYLQFKRSTTTVIIYTGVAVAISGGFMLMWLYQQPWFMDAVLLDHNLREVFQITPMNLSVAVWVGMIALVGIATDDGVVMATYLDQRFSQDKPQTRDEIREAVCEAGKRRVRPCLMTTATTLLALLPVVTSTGRGSDVMIPMAVPSIGGMAVELVTLFVVPVLYCTREEVRLWWRTR